MKIFLFFLCGLTIVVTGCAPYAVRAPQTASGNGAAKEILPPAHPDPADTVSAEKKCQKPAAAKKNDILPPVKKQTTVKKSAPPTKPVQVKQQTLPAKPEKKICTSPEKRPPEKFRRGPGFWRAFNRLPVEEQRNLLKLQRTAPERYREIMQQKVEALYAQERAKRQALDDLTATYEKTADPAKKAELKKQLRAKIMEEFKQRLQDTRKDIEAYKRRTARLEAELQKREKNCDAIVDLILDKRLNTKNPPPVPQKQ